MWETVKPADVYTNTERAVQHLQHKEKRMYFFSKIQTHKRFSGTLFIRYRNTICKSG